MATDTLTADGRARLLADGTAMPLLGLGVWQVPDGPEAERSVSWALELGYRHIDTAQAYGNERSVGRAIAASGVPRDELFVATKFYPRSKTGDAHAAAQNSLERLGLDHVDLYLIHWPEGGPTWAWPDMERAHDDGFARAIGISNFNVEEIDRLLAQARVRPLVNQVQFSAFKYRRALLEACEQRGIVLESYSTLGTGRHLDDETVTRIAERHGRTPAQVLLRWSVQRGVPVIPKSTHRERVEENAQLFDWKLSADDMAALDGLDTTGGTDRAQENKWW